MPEEWQPTSEKLEEIESLSIKVKIACEKIKDKTTETEKYISNFLNEISNHYQEI